MSLKAEMRRIAQTIEGLITEDRTDEDIAAAQRQVKRLLSRIDSLQEIADNVITADDPWEFEVKAGTCFGGKFFVEERMSRKKHLYRARQILFDHDGETVSHGVVIKCTFMGKDAQAQEKACIAEYELRSLKAIGVKANCSPYSLELIDAGCLKAPDGSIIMFWQAFEEMAGDVKLLLQILGGKLPPFLVRRLAVQMAEVLTIYHAGDDPIAHRDVKPHNILFDRPPQNTITTSCTNFKLGDTHLSKEMEDDADITQAGTISGTPQYMSPEQARGEHTSVQTDMRSLGVTLYELMTGELPYAFPQTGTDHGSSIATGSIGNYLTMIATGQPKLVSAHPIAKSGVYSEKFIKLVDRMLNNKPILRPTSF